LKIWPASTPKHSEARIIGCGTKKGMKGSVIVQKFCGVRLIRYGNTLSQYLKGMEVVASKDSRISTIWRCLRSATLFVGECEDMRHGGICRPDEKRNLGTHIQPPPPQ
jgi:hypothetical protein